MSRWQVTLLLASWEFRRYFKWKDKFVGWGIGLALMGGLAMFGPRFVEKAVTETSTFGVVGEAPFELPFAMGVEWQRGPEEELRDAYAQGDVDGLMSFESDSAGVLETRSEGGWIHSLQSSLNQARRSARLQAHALDPEVLADVTADFDIEHVLTGEMEDPEAAIDRPAPRRRASRWDKIIALGMLGFTFGGLFAGTALLFAGITSEKQQLVTEQIVAAVPPQTWIDGKILGIGFRSVTSMIEMVLWSLLGMLVWRGFVNPDFQGLTEVSPGLLTLVGVLAVLGFGLWFCFFAAIAATIDDPNTSARGVLVLVPMLAPILAIPAYLHPDSLLAQVLSVAPPTSTMAMTVRLGMTEVPAWQVAVAVLGMAATIWVLRRAAGKVFAMAILMRGKEPSWREIWNAARQPDPRGL